jgi:hypothetical protein
VTVESLQADLSALVDERQRLRTLGADELALEHNRQRIVERQQQLAAALIARWGHAGRADASA